MHKKIMIILLFCMILVIAGCVEKDIAKDSVVQKEQEELPPIEVEEIVEPSPAPVELEETPDEEVPETVPEEAPVEELEPVNKDVPAPIAELMEKAATRTNYQYFYSDGEYFVKDDKIHIILNEYVGSRHDGSMYNEVIVDKAEQKAYAFCTDRQYCGDDVPDEYWEVDYAKYDVVTPTEQLMSLSNAEIIQDATCENIKCIEIEYIDAADGLTKSMWILTYKAVPWKVQWFDDAKGKQFFQHYQTLLLSRVTDADVMIPVGYEFVEK
ncbi:MAG: hypothetical protein KAS15_03260 [Nanoarchaeota archaeon]|nr:hypothetical protein [Nanoarchaeota archaeon]MCK5630342.1 hypothetical protein [Nanoarchaeota archaeon]